MSEFIFMHITFVDYIYRPATNGMALGVLSTVQGLLESM